MIQNSDLFYSLPFFSMSRTRYRKCCLWQDATQKTKKKTVQHYRTSYIKDWKNHEGYMAMAGQSGSLGCMDISTVIWAAVMVFEDLARPWVKKRKLIINLPICWFNTSRRRLESLAEGYFALPTTIYSMIAFDVICDRYRCTFITIVSEYEPNIR